MSDKTQSSIDCLIGQLKAQYDIDIERLTVTDKANAMHKEEIINAYNLGYSEGIYQSCETGQEFYNKIYGGENGHI